MFLIRRIPRKKRRYARPKDDSWKIYKEPARELVKKVIAEVNQKHPEHNFVFNRIAIRNQRTRWGSCSSKRNLNFNYRIVNIPYELAEYLVVHELCHLKHMNHSRQYWDLVANIIPNHKEHRKKLRAIKIR